MQTEETLRDLKDDRFSLGMMPARTNSLARQQVLLLLGALAMLALWLAGLNTDIASESGIFPEEFLSGLAGRAKVDVVHRLAARTGEPGEKGPGETG